MPLSLDDAQALCAKLTRRFNGLKGSSAVQFTPLELKSGAEGLFEIGARSATPLTRERQDRIRHYAFQAADRQITQQDVRFELEAHARPVGRFYPIPVGVSRR